MWVNVVLTIAELEEQGDRTSRRGGADGIGNGSAKGLELSSWALSDLGAIEGCWDDCGPNRLDLLRVGDWEPSQSPDPLGGFA